MDNISIYDKVQRFINQFKHLHPHETEDIFLYGNCYYFAVILNHRFPEAKFMYVMVDNHFVVDICGRLYDIRGDITTEIDANYLVSWDSYEDVDFLDYGRVVRDCIKF